jgi:hypothetical protein
LQKPVYEQSPTGKPAAATTVVAQISPELPSPLELLELVPLEALLPELELPPVELLLEVPELLEFPEPDDELPVEAPLDWPLEAPLEAPVLLPEPLPPLLPLLLELLLTVLARLPQLQFEMPVTANAAKGISKSGRFMRLLVEGSTLNTNRH